MEAQEVCREIRRTASEIRQVMADADRRMDNLRQHTFRGMFGQSPAGARVDAQFSAAVTLVDTVLSHVNTAATGVTDAATTATRNVEHFEEASTEDVQHVTKIINNAAVTTDATSLQPPAQAAAAPGTQKG